MNRTAQIITNIDSWLNQSINELVIVDWSSNDNLQQFLTSKNDNRIKYIRVINEKFFLRTYGFNFGINNFCTYDKVMKLDCDVTIQNNFFETHQLKNNSFFCGEWLIARDDNERSLHGNVYFNMKDFLKINGYNNFIKSYGWEDSDLVIRLMLLGLTKNTFDYNYMYHIPHTNISRITNTTTKIFPQVQTLMYKKLSIKSDFIWNKNHIYPEYIINKISDNYYICKRINDIEYNYVFDTDFINDCILTVFSWYKDPKNLNHSEAYSQKDYAYINNFFTTL